MGFGEKPVHPSAPESLPLPEQISVRLTISFTTLVVPSRDAGEVGRGTDREVEYEVRSRSLTISKTSLTDLSEDAVK